MERREVSCYDFRRAMLLPCHSTTPPPRHVAFADIISRRQRRHFDIRHAFATAAIFLSRRRYSPSLMICQPDIEYGENREENSNRRTEERRQLPSLPPSLLPRHEQDAMRYMLFEIDRQCHYATL